MADDLVIPADWVTPGKKARALRLAKNLTQEEMADIIGLTRAAVGAYETRPRGTPSAEVLHRLSDRYGVDMSWFYDGEDTPIKYNTPLVGSDLPGGIATGEITLKVLNGHRLGAKEEVVYAESEVWGKNAPLFLQDIDHRSHRVLVVKGDDLKPRAPEGTYLIFKNDPAPPTDTIVLVRRDGGDLLRVRAFLEIQGKRLLGNFANELSDELNESWEIVGAVSRIILPYQPGKPNVEQNGGEFLPATKLTRRSKNG